MLALLAGCTHERPFRLTDHGTPSGSPAECTEGSQACVPPGTLPAPDQRIRSSSPRRPAAGAHPAGRKAIDTESPSPTAGATARAPSPDAAGPLGRVRIPALNVDPFAGPLPRGGDTPPASTTSRPHGQDEPDAPDGVSVGPPTPPADSPPRLTAPPATRSSGSRAPQSPHDNPADAPETSEQSLVTPDPDGVPAAADKLQPQPRATKDTPAVPTPTDGDASPQDHPRDESDVSPETPDPGDASDRGAPPEPPQPLRVDVPPLRGVHSPFDEHDELHLRLRALRNARADRRRARADEQTPHLSLRQDASGRSAPIDRHPARDDDGPIARTPGDARDNTTPPFEFERADPTHAGAADGAVATNADAAADTQQADAGERPARATVPPLSPRDRDTSGPPESQTVVGDALPLIVPLPTTSPAPSAPRSSDRATPPPKSSGSPVELVNRLAPIPTGAANLGQALVHTTDHHHIAIRGTNSGVAGFTAPRAAEPIPDAPSTTAAPHREGHAGDTRNGGILRPTSLTTPSRRPSTTAQPEMPTPAALDPPGAVTTTGPATAAWVSDSTTDGSRTSGPAFFASADPVGADPSTTADAPAISPDPEHRDEPLVEDADGSRATRIAVLPAPLPNRGTGPDSGAAPPDTSTGPSGPPRNEERDARDDGPPRWTLFLALAGAGALIAAVCRRWIPESKRKGRQPSAADSSRGQPA
ncbi:MAG: hypothetical protein D6725_14565 [Planctomycetota bacterium]|nr:MAG: hypothetical protein D6725_14565 [Planctomycetota bacterium]